MTCKITFSKLCQHPKPVMKTLFQRPYFLFFLFWDVPKASNHPQLLSNHRELSSNIRLLFTIALTSPCSGHFPATEIVSNAPSDLISAVKWFPQTDLVV